MVLRKAFAEQLERLRVYDIAPPHDANWHLFQHVGEMSVMHGRQFVITSTNAQHVERIAGPQQHVYEIVGKPYDLGEVVRAVKETSRARATR